MSDGWMTSLIMDPCVISLIVLSLVIEKQQKKRLKPTLFFLIISTTILETCSASDTVVHNQNHYFLTKQRTQHTSLMTRRDILLEISRVPFLPLFLHKPAIVRVIWGPRCVNSPFTTTHLRSLPDRRHHSRNLQVLFLNIRQKLVTDIYR